MVVVFIGVFWFNDYFNLVWFSGSFNSGEVGGMYSSSGYGDDYMPRGSDVCPIPSFLLFKILKIYTSLN